MSQILCPKLDILCETLNILGASVHKLVGMWNNEHIIPSTNGILVHLVILVC